METVAYILGLALTGLVVGALARLLLPGRDPMSIFETMVAGIAGTLIAGLVTYYAFDREAAPGILLSLIPAVAIVYVVRKFRERQVGPEARSASPGLGGFQTSGVTFMPGCLITSLLLSLFLTLVLNLLIRAF
jgi:uncharacterized membrane protein YeaQ/YmgE (transglycosylase-associated protein family)